MNSSFPDWEHNSIVAGFWKSLWLTLQPWKWRKVEARLLSRATEFQQARIAAANETKREVWAYVKEFTEKQAGRSFPDDGSTFEDWMRAALSAAANEALEKAAQIAEKLYAYSLNTPETDFDAVYVYRGDIADMIQVAKGKLGEGE